MEREKEVKFAFTPSAAVLETLTQKEFMKDFAMGLMLLKNVAHLKISRF